MIGERDEHDENLYKRGEKEVRPHLEVGLQEMPRYMGIVPCRGECSWSLCYLTKGHYLFWYPGGTRDPSAEPIENQDVQHQTCADNRKLGRDKQSTERLLDCA